MAPLHPTRSLRFQVPLLEYLKAEEFGLLDLTRIGSGAFSHSFQAPPLYDVTSTLPDSQSDFPPLLGLVAHSVEGWRGRFYPQSWNTVGRANLLRFW